jgi:hypothetical protein
MNAPAECPSCRLLAEQLARQDGGEVCCPLCRSTLGEPPPPPERLHSARREITALVRWGHLLEGRAAGLASSPGGGGDPGRGRPDAVDERSTEIARACRAQARLRELRARPRDDGPRYAGVLWFAHGERGAVLNGWQSVADQVTERYAREGEVSAWLCTLDPRKRARLTEPMEPIAFGNALLAAATDAYELNRWTPLLPAPLPPPMSARVRWLKGVAERWEAARKKYLGPSTAPPDSSSNSGEP